MNSSTWSDAQALAYIASYADLRRIFGTDPEAGRRHYATAGAAEGRSISFDGLAYNASYRDLATGLGVDAAAGARHFIAAGAAEGRVVTFDALSYIASYADLRSGFGTNAVAATQHYITAGMSEGRVATFDALSYIASYSDLIRIYGTDTASATRHYITAGAAEGRVATFDALSYIASYGDLSSAFGADAAVGARHYIAAGAAEGRTVSFDALAYIASYSDLAMAFGTNATAGARHFIQAGRSEGRGIHFDPVAYLLSNGDLSAAGFTAGDAVRHWITNGLREGRTASGSFGIEQTGHDLRLGGNATGAIEQAGDRDWFQLTLDPGQAVRLDLGFAVGQSGSMSVVDASGRAVTGVADAGTLSFVADKGGTYYVVVAGTGGNYALTAAEDINKVVGTAGNDVLNGSERADLMQGLGGDDTINGRAGNDVLEGGSGVDTLDGGLGNDTLYGNNAANSGADGGDFLRDTQGGNDRLYGQDGNDVLEVFRQGAMAASNVVMDGGQGDDTIVFASVDRYLDIVNAVGGDGDDRIDIGTVARSVIDAGAGNDRVSITMLGGDQTITLGAGIDTLTLKGSAGAFSIGNPTRVTDFRIGTDTMNIDQYLGDTLQGWDKGSNPFATGHLKLVQSGGDTLLQLDRDGSAGNAYGFATLLTLSNTVAADFTVKELGYAPSGMSGEGKTILGTVGNDTLTGTDGADTIRGLAGDDTLYGRAGNDVLEGGLGFDTLDGGLGDDVLYGNNAANTGEDGVDYLLDTQGGNDRLYGQDGGDSLYVSRQGTIAASTVLMDGGQGNDDITFDAANRFLDTVTVAGGDGHDLITIGTIAKSLIDAGAGDDRVTITMLGGDQTITLGMGADTLTLRSGGGFAVGNPTRVTDFQVGSDMIDLDRYLADTLQGWNQGSNPFASGHLKLVQSGGDTLLQLDRDGSGGTYGFSTLVTFAGTTATSFTARDLGYAPTVGTATSAAEPIGWAPQQFATWSSDAMWQPVHADYL